MAQAPASKNREELIRSWSIQASGATLVRARRLASALLKAFEAKGYPVKADPQTRQIFVLIAGQKTELRIREQTKRVPHVLTAAEERQKARGDYYYHPAYDFPGKGELTLGAGERYVGREWSDGKRLKLEDKLAQLVEGIEQVAQAAADRHAAWERQRLESERRAEERAAEEKRQQQLKFAMSNWQTAKAVRVFVQEMQLALEQTTLSEHDGLGEWLAWAKRYADRIDPTLTITRNDHPAEELLDRIGGTYNAWFRFAGQ